MWAFLGVVLSAAWLGLVYLWFERSFGLENLEYLLPGEMGQFLAGVMAPLALIWVIVGFLRTGSRLRRLTLRVAELAEIVDAAPPRPPLSGSGRRGDPADGDPPREATGRSGAPAPLLATPAAGSAADLSYAPAPGYDEGQGKVTPLPQEAVRTPHRLPDDERVSQAAEEALDPEFRQRFVVEAEIGEGQMRVAGHALKFDRLTMRGLWPHHHRHVDAA